MSNAWTKISELPIEISEYEEKLTGHDREFGDFTRPSTVVHLRGGGEEGIGEDVVYDVLDHIAHRDAGPFLDLTAPTTMGEACRLLGELDLFPEPRPSATRPGTTAAGRMSRPRSTSPCARTGSRSGRWSSATPSHFASSARPGSAALATMRASRRTEPIRKRLDRYPGLEFKLDPENDWDPGADRRDRRAGNRAGARPEGHTLGATEHAIQIEMRPGKLPVVRLDVEAGVDCALEHLRELGHRRIAHVASNFVAPTFDLRRERIIARLGDAPPTALAPFTFDGAAAAAGPLLDAGGFSAVFCDDDILAGGVYLAARERGIAIPGDLSVVGFDDLDFARVLAPPLTTVGVDAEGLGAAAFEALARDLAGEPVAAEQVIPVALCVRESTAAPRA